MKLEIRDMCPEDCDGKGYVHYISWQETYSGLIDPDYLSRMKPEKCQDMAHRWPQNTLVAELNGKIVGFSCYHPCQDADMTDCGEVMAIYVLREAQGMGIGRKLMDAALEKLPQFKTIVIWVLKGNAHAIGFYEHYGFRPDGTEKEILLGTPNTELRMVYHRP